MTTWSLIVSDFRRHRQYGSSTAVIWLFTQGFWAVFQYRLANAIHRKITIRFLRIPLKFWMLCWQKTIEITAGISIPASASIGSGLYIGHFGGIIINSGAVIGDNCNISQGVTIGVSGRERHRGVPKIGNNVYLGANCVIAGNIVVGNHVLVGACSLVNQDVPDSAVVAGVPSEIVSYKGSEGYI